LLEITKDTYFTKIIGHPKIYLLLYILYFTSYVTDQHAIKLGLLYTEIENWQGWYEWVGM